MPYQVVSKKSGKTYYLNAREQTLRNGHKVTLYFFSTQPRDGAIDALPKGYEVSESDRTGLPILKKSR